MKMQSSDQDLNSNLNNATVSGIPSAIVQRGAGQIIRARNRAAASAKSAAIQTFAQASADSFSEIIPLRRSQRIKDLEAWKNKQSELLPRESQQNVSNAMPQRKQKGLLSKSRNLSPKARPRGITKSRMPRKRSLSRAAKQVGR